MRTEWYDASDFSPSVIPPRDLLRDRGFDDGTSIPENVVVFHTGFAIPYLVSTQRIREFPFRIPGFLSNPPVYGHPSRQDACLIQGGYGAPAAACLIEVAVELGCRRLFAFGLGGGVAEEVQLGDLVVPSEVIREEGTSFHYAGDDEDARPDRELLDRLREFLAGFRGLRVHEGKTVSTDAPFRQTLNKELRWRREGVLAVEMEISAVLTVARHHGIPAVSLLAISDKHDLEGNTPWVWDEEGMREGRTRGIEVLLDFVAELEDTKRLG